MALLSDQVKRQLRERLAQRLSGPVQVTLYTRPGTGRLILPSGLGCATCDEARQLAEDIADAVPDLVRLQVIDVTAQPAAEAAGAAAPGAEAAAEVTDLPTLALAFPGEPPRIRWQGLPAGYEFATVVDAMERVSRGEHGLAEDSVTALARLQEPIDLMVFATPT